MIIVKIINPSLPQNGENGLKNDIF